VDPDPGWEKILIRIRDEHPGSYFRELRNNFLGLNYINSYTRILIRDLLDLGSGKEKIRNKKTRIRNTAN
jgi:hypothetical protein